MYSLFQFISTTDSIVLIKALNRNKPSVRGLVNTVYKYKHKLPVSAMEYITHRDIPLQLLIEKLPWPVVQRYWQSKSEFSLKWTSMQINLCT